MDLKMRNGFVGSFERTVNAALSDILEPFGDATVNDPALLGSIFVVYGRLFGKDCDCAARHLELELIAALKTGLPANGLWYYERRFVFDGYGHGE